MVAAVSELDEGDTQALLQSVPQVYRTQINDVLLTALSRAFHEHSGIDLEPARIVEELLDRVVARVSREVPWRPGALDLLHDLRAEGVRCALVTMSYRRFVAPILATLPDGIFEVIVTGDTVSQGKPHPEPYQKAAAILGVDPAHTIAIEDSNTGARSAEAAGCTVLVVQNHVPVLPGERRIFVETLANGDKVTVTYQFMGTMNNDQLVSGTNTWTAAGGTGKL